LSGGTTRIRAEIDGRVLIVTLDRAKRRNAVDRLMAQELNSAFDAFEADEGLSVAVIRGSGGVFSAGADLRELAEREGLELPSRGFAGLCATRPGKPLIAAVDGYALGGGLEIALACDIIVLGADAGLALPEVTHGLAALAGGVTRLRARLSPDRAAELMLTGRRFTAQEAVEWGLGLPAEGDGAVATALRLARAIAQHPLAGLRETTGLLRAVEGPAMSPAESVARVTALLADKKDAERRGSAHGMAARRVPQP
jgi:enoyl-CoA hydratase